MPCRHNGAVVLVVERSAAKVDHADRCVLHRALLSFLIGKEQRGVKRADQSLTTDPWSRPSGASHLLNVEGHCEVRADKEDVLRFQVCVSQLVVVENWREEQLVSILYPSPEMHFKLEN